MVSAVDLINMAFVVILGTGTALDGQANRINKMSNTDKKTGASFVDCYGYTNCVKLENGSTRVILEPSCGGRVLEYSLNGKNSLYVDPAQNGWVYRASKKGIDPSGARMDFGPEKTVPAHPDLWLGKWHAEITSEHSARMTSVKDKNAGVQLVREFTLDESSSKLTVTQRIRNISKKTKHYCHWGRTLALGGGICIIPLTPNSRFPNKYIMYENGSTINYAPVDSNIILTDKYIEVVGTPAYPKLGLDSYTGWFCYLTPNDLMFVKRFATYPDRVYNEIAGLTISIWYYKDVMCELEPIGPREDIQPGQSVSFTEQWWLIPYEFPKKPANIDPKQVAQAVQKYTH